MASSKIEQELVSCTKKREIGIEEGQELGKNDMVEDEVNGPFRRQIPSTLVTWSIVLN